MEEDGEPKLQAALQDTVFVNPLQRFKNVMSSLHFVKIFWEKNDLNIVARKMRKNIFEDA